MLACSSEWARARVIARASGGSPGGRRAAPLVFRGRNAVAAILGEELRPFLEAAGIERMRIARVQALDCELQIGVRPHFYTCTSCRHAFPLARRVCSVLR